MNIAFELNGKNIETDVPARTTLADCIRHHLMQTGTHVGCEHGVCGACTIIVDGLSVKSCTVLTPSVEGSSVTTLEGLAGPDGELHPMQAAFREEHGLQCGFCTPGMVMAAIGVLADNPDPTDREVREGLEGNLCRCTGYHNIVRAVRTAAQAGPAAGQVPQADQEVTA